MKSIKNAFRDTNEEWRVSLTIEYNYPSKERYRYALSGKLGVNSLQTALKLAQEVCTFPVNEKLLEPFGGTGRRWILQREFKEALVYLIFDKHEGRRWESP